MDSDIAYESKGFLLLDFYKYAYKNPFAETKHLAGEGKI